VTVVERRMRIGIILLSLGIGGTEKRLARLYQFLARHSRHQYYLAAPDRVLRLLRQQGILTDDSLELHRIDCGVWQRPLEHLRWSYYLGLPGWRRGLSRALRRADAVAKTDVFHYALPISHFIAPPRYRRHSVMEAMDSAHEWHIELMLRAAARRGTIVNCLSLPIYQSLARRLTPDAVRQLHLSPGSLLDSVTEGSQPTPKERRVVFVGRLESVKNPLLFVEALGRLARRTRDFRASILGDGRLRERVNSRIRELGLADIVALTFHDRPRQVLTDSAVFVSLQAMDNYPSQALLEAMACRCAIVASDVGTTRKLVTPETGLLVPFDADAIADAIWSLLADPAKATRMGCAAQALANREHSIERYAAHIERLYEVASAVPEPG
jgi:glycosyltransferase involved in cell wall biosynthesis